MKNYKKLVPLALVFLICISCYKLVSDAAGKERQYSEYVEQARAKNKDGIYADAFRFYKQAFDMYRTVELADEMGKAVTAQGKKRDEIEWGEYMTTIYPTKYNGYQYLMEAYLRENNYSDCFRVYDTAKKRQALSDRIQAIRAEIEYRYEIEFGSYEEVSAYSGGLCAVKADGYWGYADTKGEIAIRNMYARAGAFSSDLAPVQEEGGEAYFINVEGNKTMILPKGKTKGEAGLFSNGIYPLSWKGKAGYFNEKGEALLDTYDAATVFNYDIAAVKQGEEWYFIKRDGTKLNNTVYEEVALDEKNIAYRNERAFAKTEKGYVMLDLTGQPVASQIFDNAKPFLDNTLAAVQAGTRWGFVDQSGKMVIQPAFEEAESFSNGFAAVKSDGRWGYIDQSGKIVIKPEFNGAKPFTQDETAYVKVNEQWSMLKLLRSNY